MRVSVLAGCVLVVAACPAFSATVHVAPDGSGDYPTIQAAIDAVSSGDEIVLADGTFTGDGNWDLNFGTKDLVLRSEHGYEATIIDCGFDGIHDIRHRGVILEGGQTAATVIEGITFEKSQGPMDGGSVRCVGASPVLRRLRIRGNLSQGRGGGVFAQSASPTIHECVFIPDSRSRGEGTALFGEKSSFVVQACDFQVSGARIVSVDDGTFTDCIFDGNIGSGMRTGGEQGIGILARGGAVSILGCTFRDIFGWGISVRPEAEVVIGSCLYEGNIGDSGVLTTGNTTIRNTNFLRNQAGWHGSAVDAYAGVLLMDHCVLFDNWAGGWPDLNGTVTIGDATATITHCTFAKSRGIQRGSAIEIWNGGRVAIDHSIIAFGGPPTDAGGAVFCLGTPEALSVTCTNIFGNESGDWVGCVSGMDGTNGNLSADPLFCDIDEGDLSLYGDSPCAPANTGECGLIGALGPWCGPLAVEGRSWGTIKALYR